MVEAKVTSRNTRRRPKDCDRSTSQQAKVYKTKGKTRTPPPKTQKTEKSDKKGKTRTKKHSTPSTKDKHLSDESSSDEDCSQSPGGVSSENTASDSSEEEKSKYGYCSKCGSVLTRDLSSCIMVNRYLTEEERLEASNASKRRWQERNIEKVRESNRIRSRKWREMNKVSESRNIASRVLMKKGHTRTYLTEKERREANNATKQRWQERNIDKVREGIRRRTRKWRERKKEMGESPVESQ